MSTTRRSWLLGAAATLTAAPSPAAPASGKPKAPRSLLLKDAELWRPGVAPTKQSVLIVGDTIRTIAPAIAAGDAEVIDGAGLVLTAGLVDPLTQVGVVDVDLEKSARDDAEATARGVRAAFTVSYAFDSRSPVVPVARTGGLTSVGVVPRGGFVMGQSAWVDLAGTHPRADVVEAHLALHVDFNASFGEHDGPAFATALLRVRDLIDDARTYAKNTAAFDQNRVRRLGATRRDLAAVARALGGKLPVVFHVDREAEIRATLELASTEKLRAIIAGGAEAWQLADEIAAARVPVLVDPFEDLPHSFATLGAREDAAALLVKAGVSVALTTRETHHSRRLRQAAGNAVRAGLTRDQALGAVTFAAADALGMGARYGRVEAGRVANLVLWSGDPFETSTRVVHSVVRGASRSLRTHQTALFERYARAP